jgi:indolepyruvate ferredoxin oxidoreductase, alpha subunit
MHSSQNEQDNRLMAQLAGVPVLEPSSPQEVKDFMKYGIEISEQFEIPILMRTTTRVCRTRAVLYELQHPEQTMRSINEMREAYQKRRDIIMEGFNEIEDF